MAKSNPTMIFKAQTKGGERESNKQMTILDYHFEGSKSKSINPLETVTTGTGDVRRIVGDKVRMSETVKEISDQKKTTRIVGDNHQKKTPQIPPSDLKYNDGNQ